MALNTRVQVTPPPPSLTYLCSCCYDFFKLTKQLKLERLFCCCEKHHSPKKLRKEFILDLRSREVRVQKAQQQAAGTVTEAGSVTALTTCGKQRKQTGSEAGPQTLQDHPNDVLPPTRPHLPGTSSNIPIPAPKGTVLVQATTDR